MAMAAPDTEWEAEDETGSGSYIYFRRPDGSIAVSDLGKNNTQLHDRQNEGWEPLPQYGQLRWDGYAAEHPYEVLLMRGGAAEFSVAQLVELGYHLAPDPDPRRRSGKTRYGPPFVPGCRRASGEAGHGGNPRRTAHHPRCWGRGAYPAFPQLDGTEGDGAACAFCDDGLVYATTKARNQHVGVMHKEEMREARMGQEMAAVLAQKLGRMGMAIPGYACNLCPDTFANLADLAAHAERHRTEAADLALAGPQATPRRGRPPKDRDGTDES